MSQAQLKVLFQKYVQQRGRRVEQQKWRGESRKSRLKWAYEGDIDRFDSVEDAVESMSRVEELLGTEGGRRKLQDILGYYPSEGFEVGGGI